MTAARQHDRRLVAWLSLAQLISWGSVFYLFALIMAPIERELGLSRAQSSLAFSLALLAEGLLAYPVGRLIDQGHERVVMAGGSVLLGVCLLLHSTVTTLAGYYAVWVALGVGMAATLYTPVFAVVTRRFPDGVAPLHFFLLKNAPPRGGCAPLGPGQAAPANDSHQPVSQKPIGQPATAPTLKDHLTSAPYLLIGLFVVLMMAVTAALPAHMVSLLRENGLSEAWAIAIPASIGIVQVVVGRMLLFFFEHRFDIHTANRLIPCLMPLGLMALLGASSWGGAQAGGSVFLVLLFVFLWGRGNGMLTIVKGTAMAQYVSREHVASLNGALGIPLALARASAPIGLGLLWSQQSGYTNGLWVMLGLSVAGVVALAMAQRLAWRKRPL